MGKVERFEDLVAWQNARRMTKAVYQATEQQAFRRDAGLRDQIRRAAVSVMSNIAEGFDRGSRADFHRFLVIAKSSCAEVRSHLYVALDAGHLGADDFEKLHQAAGEVGRILSGLRTAVMKQRVKEASPPVTSER